MSDQPYFTIVSIVLLNNNNSIISIYSMLTSITLQQHIYTENYKYKYKIV